MKTLSRPGAEWVDGPARLMGVLLLLLPAAYAFGGCDGKDTCPDLHGVPCADVGLEDKSGKAYCDECGEVWECGSRSRVDESGTWFEYALGKVGVPCTCINDAGYVDLYDPDRDTGDPYDWDPDCWVEY